MKPYDYMSNHSHFTYSQHKAMSEWVVKLVKMRLEKLAKELAEKRFDLTAEL